MESTFALNVLQKLDHCFTITNNIFFCSITKRRRFIYIDKDAFGKQSDGGIFSGSTLYPILEDLESTLPKPTSFEESGTEMPFVIVGDEACPRKTYLMTPFARRDVM